MSKQVIQLIRRVTLAVICGIAAVGCHPSPPGPTSPVATQPSLAKFDYVQPKMGTVFHIVLYAPDKGTADRAADEAFARVDELNKALSDYAPDSELSRLSRQSRDGPMPRPVVVGN